MERSAGRRRADLRGGGGLRVALVWPSGFDTWYALPLALGYLVANVDARRHELRVFDCALDELDADSPELWRRLQAFDPDVIGVSCWTHTFDEASRVLREARRRHPLATNVIGGVHPTVYPESALALDEVDFVFRGESEQSFAVFLDQLASARPDWTRVRGLAHKGAEGVVVENELAFPEHLDAIRTPDYDAIALDRYLAQGYRYDARRGRQAPIWATRGCPYRCSFCAAPILNGREIRRHSAEYVMRWIDELYRRHRVRHVNLIDDNFTFDADYAKDLCRRIIDRRWRGLHFGTPNGIRVQRTDPELFGLMKRAGWQHLVIGVESGSKTVLRRMKKGLEPDEIPLKVQQIKDAGLKVHGLFMIGMPGETREDLDKTVALLRRCRFNFFLLSNFQPLPGTEAFHGLVDEGEISPDHRSTNFSGGRRSYVPGELAGYNFAWLVLREYLHLALSDPANTLYMVRRVHPQMIARKLLQNGTSMARTWLKNLRSLRRAGQ